jgi:hypothetical protein
MKPSMKWVLTTLAFAVVSMALTQVVWPSDSADGPPSGLLPLFIVIGVLEWLAFGFGMAFLIFGAPLLAKLGQSRGLTTAAYVSTGWLLVSWWPHSNLHRVNGADNWGGLLAIEYGFHATLIAAGVVLAYFLFRTMSALVDAKA